MFLSFEVLKHHCDLNLEHSNQVFHNTLRLVTMHHQTKGGNERIISSENVETDVFWLHDCSL